MKCLNMSLPLIQEGLQITGSEVVLAKIMDSLGENATISDIQTSFDKMKGYSSKTLSRVNEFLNRIGVNVKSVNQIVVDGKKLDATAIADSTRSLIEYVNGNETDLTEEAMHFAVEILEQTNSSLFNQMFNKIDSYPIYRTTFNAYSNNPLYQIDGKPNIRKIKKEAIGRKLADRFIERVDPVTDHQNNLFSEWWFKVKQFFDGLFTKTGFNPFDKSVEKILSGEIGTTSDIKEGEQFLHLADSEQKRVYDSLKRTLVTKTATGYELNGKEIPRVSSIVKSFYERIFKDRDVNKSDYQKAVDDIKAESGTAGHLDMEALFKFSIDEDGFIRDKPLNDDKYVPQTNPAIYPSLRDNFQERLRTFPTGTRFLSETVIFNGKNLAGTVDFIAISPDGKVTILDWKFTEVNIENKAQEKEKDVPWYKKKAYRIQMAQYKKILQDNYGVRPADFAKTEMIPIRAIYTYSRDFDGKAYPKLSKVSIGNVDAKLEDRDFLLPVALEQQSTGDHQLDKLLKKLMGLRETLEDRAATTQEERYAKAQQLNALEKALRHLQMKQSVIPLVEQADVYTKELDSLFKYFDQQLKDKDFNNIDNTVLSDFGIRLNKAFDDIQIYTNLDNETSSLFRGTLTPEQQKVFDKVSDVVKTARRLASNLEQLAVDFAEKIAESEGYSNINSPETVVAFNRRLFNETSKLPLKTLQVFYQKRREAQNKMDFQTSEENRTLLEVVKEKYDKLAKSKGWDLQHYFDILVVKGTNRLIDEFKMEFYKDAKTATQEKDFEWIQENIDVEAFKKKLAENYQKRLDYFNTKFYEGTTQEVAKKRKKDIEAAKAEFDTSKKDSLGWYNHYYTMRGFPIKDKWTSDEWKNLTATGNEAAKELYDWIIKVNEKADEAGYLPDDASKRVFLPFIPKSFTEKMVFGGKVTLMDQFIRNITVDEDTVGYGNIDKVTNKLVNKIPKYFTTTPSITLKDGSTVKYTKITEALLKSKDYTQEEIDKVMNTIRSKEASTDLFKNLALYNESVNRYKQVSEIEGIALALGRVERNKSSIVTSYWGKPKFDVTTNEFDIIDNNDKNADLYDRQIATLVYGQKYVESEQFDQLMGKVGDVFTKANKLLGVDIFPEDLSERQLSMNKGIDTLNRFFQQKTLGLNPLSSISNFFGGTFQAIISAGHYFNKADFIKSEMELSSQAFTGDQGKKIVAAMKYFMPFTEDRQNRDIINKLSLMKINDETVQDFLFSMMRVGDYMVQGSIFLSNLRNQILIDGKIMNARDYIRDSAEAKDRYSSPEKLKEFNDSFEDKVKEAIDKHGLLKQATVENDHFTIPGVDRNDKGVYKVRNISKELSKKALGNMTPEEVRGVQQNVYLRSVMVFKNWIPSLIDVRLGQTKFNAATDAYEWGRTRTVARFLLTNGLSQAARLHSAVKGTEKGLEALNTLYEYKKKAYFEATGQELDMTKEEFYDMVRENIRQQAKDTILAIGIMAMFVAVSMAKPDDDDDEHVKNIHKFTVRALDKLSDELTFFYSPMAVQQILNGSIFPSLGVFTDIFNILNHFGKEVWGMTFDEKLQEKNYVIKYMLKATPVVSQLSTYLPLYAPELAKELGIQISKQSRLR